MSHPFEDTSKDERVGLNICQLDSFNVLFDPIELLVQFEGLRLRSKWLVKKNSIEEFLIDEFMSFLPTKFISEFMTDLLSFIAQEIENSLPDSLALDHFEGSKLKDFIHPLRHQA